MSHSCRDCCGPPGGPTRDALAVQVVNLMAERDQQHGIAVAAVALEHGADPLQTLVSWDMTARLRWRADHLERQLRDAGILPHVPAFPGVADPGRWLAQIERAKAATRKNDEEAA